MKKIKTLFLFLFASMGLFGQSNFNQVWDSLYREIKIPGSLNTGYFWNLGYLDSFVDNHQGLSTDEISDYQQLSNYYQQFYNSSISYSQTLQPYEQFQTQLQEHFNGNLIAFPILFLRGGMLQSNAYKESAISFDSNQYKMVLNRPESAFKIQDVFIGAPYIPVSFKPQVNLLFSDELIVNTTGIGIKRIQIKLRNETYQDIQMNVPSTYVLLPGDNELTVQVSFMDGKIREIKTNIAFETRDLNSGIANKHAMNNPFHFGDEFGNIYAEPERETELKQALGAYIDYLPGLNNGQANTCIKKPIVIVEGIDFGYKDHWSGCYGGKCGSTGLIDLVNGYLYNPYESKEKDRIENWAAIEKAPQFISQLRSRGYDIFYIDFHNGADYMENNAQLVVKFIQLLNQRKCSDEEIVVVGTSMGGIVAKYALSYMEKHQMPHCVRTYLSFDAPHQGANIPFGLQSFMQYFSGKLPTMKENFKRKLDRAASRQLLILNILSGTKPSPHQDRIDFLKKQEALGNYPKLSRNIALCNGSIDSSFQNFNPGDLLLALNPISANIENNPFKMTAYVFAMSKTYQAQSWEKSIQIAMYVMLPFGLKHIMPLENNPACYDHRSGGIRYDLRDFRRIYGLMNVINFHSSTCFIPTTSALDLTSKVGQKVDNYVDRFVPNPSVYPFQTYYGVEQTNEEHMQLSDANIKWMIDEFEKNANEVGPILSQNYNYGRYERKTLPSVIVQSQGRLQINAHGLNGFGTGEYDRMNRKGSTFEMVTSECNSLVLIDQDGVLELGTDNIENNKANLTIRRGCRLVLKAGSTLLVHDHSVLKIEEGAELVYFPGAKIILDGQEATLQIDGKLRLETNAVFSVSKANAAQTGFVKFRNAKGGYGEAQVEIGGPNVKIELIGTGKKEDVLLQVEGEMNLTSAKGLYALKQFSLSNCQVLFGNLSSIKLASPAQIHEVDFALLPWAQKGSSTALIVDNSAELKIDNSDFTGFNFGLKSLGSATNQNLLRIEHSKFNACDVGVYAHSVQAIFDFCTFRNCIEKGLLIEDQETDVTIKNSNFQSNYTGAKFLNTTGASRMLSMESCEFGSNVTGLDLFKLQSNISCTRFISNETGLSDADGILNLCKDKTLSGSLYSGSGGNNTFAYNSRSGIMVKGSVLYLNNGYNNFLQTSGNLSNNFILGDVVYQNETHQNTSPYALKAAHNFWMDKPSNNNLSNGAMSLYFLKFSPPQSNGSTLNYLTGDLLSDVNKLCYAGNACNPCQIVSQTEGEFASKDVKMDHQIYPHPASDYLEIQFNSETVQEIKRVQLLDIQGRIVLSAEGNSSILHLSTADLANGIYFLKINSSRDTQTKQILIKH